VTVIKSIDVFLNIASGHRCIRVFKLPLYLDARARLVVLFRHLYSWNLSLLEGPSCLNATAFYEVPVGFPLGRRKFVGGMVNVNK